MSTGDHHIFGDFTPAASYAVRELATEIYLAMASQNASTQPNPTPVIATTPTQE